MCGHAGFAVVKKGQAVDSRTVSMFLNTFVTSQLRGMHGSGVGVVWDGENKKKRRVRGFFVEKDLSSPADVWYNALVELDNKAEKHTKNPKPYVVIGHSRHATIGEQVQGNNHPFRFNNHFVGAHNGTITNADFVYNALLKDGTPLEGTQPVDLGDIKTKTDSEIILYCIYRYGIDAVYPKISGAWAFIWFDYQKETLNFIRNHARSLFYMVDPNNESIHWSSERDMLLFAWAREMNKAFTKDDAIEFQPHYLHTVKVAGNRVVLPAERQHFKWDERREVKSYTVITYGGHYNRHEPVNPAYNSTRPDGTLSDRRIEVDGQFFGVHPVVSRPSVPTVRTLFDPLSDTDNSDDESPAEDPEELGCVCCGAEIHVNDNFRLELGKQGIVCGNCSHDLAALLDLVDVEPDLQGNPTIINQILELQEIAGRKQHGKILN